MKRKIVCPCGHPMQAADDEELYKVVRRHVDEFHPELNYSKDDIMNMIAQEAMDV
ncbi:MAG: hypothetical protein JOZ96_23880 [Acidobacteria bacterium]|nr:hypothetical protein [Acidobacteriota bacterium]